jgi:hypothetical protein
MNMEADRQSGSTPQPGQDLERLDALEPVAVFLVGGDNELGPYSVRLLADRYSKDYRQILFVSVGVMDYAVLDQGVDAGQGFKGTEEAGRLMRKTRLQLDPYLAAAHELGLKAVVRVSVATDPVGEIGALSDEIVKAYPRAAFFLSKLVFSKWKWFHRLLHEGTGDAIQALLERKGFPVTVLPLVLPT